MKTFSFILAIVLAVVIVVLLGILVFVPRASAPGTPSTPAATATTEGLQVSLPQANAVISSPVAIEGTVTDGGWFFEASFPIKVYDADGMILGTGTAQALSDWMSTGTVPFSASISFGTPHSATGTIVFQNDNPSGLPANAKSVSISITFK